MPKKLRKIKSKSKRTVTRKAHPQVPQELGPILSPRQQYEQMLMRNSQMGKDGAMSPRELLMMQQQQMISRFMNPQAGNAFYSQGGITRALEAEDRKYKMEMKRLEAKAEKERLQRLKEEKEHQDKMEQFEREKAEARRQRQQMEQSIQRERELNQLSDQNIQLRQQRDEYRETHQYQQKIERLKYENELLAKEADPEQMQAKNAQIAQLQYEQEQLKKTQQQLKKLNDQNQELTVNKRILLHQLKQTLVQSKHKDAKALVEAIDDIIQNGTPKSQEQWQDLYNQIETIFNEMNTEQEQNNAIYDSVLRKTGDVIKARQEMETKQRSILIEVAKFKGVAADAVNPEMVEEFIAQQNEEARAAAIEKSVLDGIDTSRQRTIETIAKNRETMARMGIVESSDLNEQFRAQIQNETVEEGKRDHLKRIALP